MMYAAAIVDIMLSKTRSPYLGKMAIVWMQPTNLMQNVPPATSVILPEKGTKLTNEHLTDHVQCSPALQIAAAQNYSLLNPIKRRRKNVHM